MADLGHFGEDSPFAFWHPTHGIQVMSKGQSEMPMWATYRRLIDRSQILPSGTRACDRLIRRMASLEQALAMSPAQSLDHLVIKLNLLAWILFPSADPGAGDHSGSVTSLGIPSLPISAIRADTTEGLLLRQILADAQQLAAHLPGAGNAIKDPAK